MWISLWDCLSVFLQSNQSKRGEYSKEFAHVFLKPPQSTGSFPSFPDDLFSSIQLEGKMCMGPNWSRGGGWILCSYITSTLISLASTRSHVTAHWERSWEIKSSCVPAKTRKQIWLNRESGEVINQNREHKKKKYACFHSVWNCFSWWFLLDFPLFLW